MTGQQLYKRLGVAAPFDPNHTLVTSYALSPIWLAFVRLLLAFYTLFTALFDLIWDAVVTHNAKSYFSYFTDLSYIGLCAYFWASGVQTLFYARGNGKSYPLQRWHPILQFLHVLLFATIMTFPIVVTVVYWSLLASSSSFDTRFDAWANVSRHILNTAFVLFEIAFTHAGPTPWIHLPFIIIFGVSYLAVAYITHATQGFYSYSFLDPHKNHGFVAVYIVGILVAACVIFAAAQVLCMLRERLVAPRAHREVVNIDDWQTVERPESLSAV